MHPLDNVIWRALTTRQKHFAESYGSAYRFLREVTLLNAFEEPSDSGYESLARLVGSGGTAGLLLEQPFQSRAEWSVVGGAPLLEMVCENGESAANGKASHPEILELGSADSPEMVELAHLTKPGPFANRTHELGDYIGIRFGGKLVAMAGERLKIPGYTEISAVCTHPDHTGKGYAQLLMTELMQRIRTRGEKSFLHVRCDNARAVQIYERLGFRTRVELHYVVLRAFS